MKTFGITAVLVLALGCFAAAQATTRTTPAQDNNQESSSKPGTWSNSSVPEGTQVKKTEPETVVQPTMKPIRVTPAVIRSAQSKLKDKGLYNGAEDGVEGPQTRAAVRKFQQDEALPVTGRLDEKTMSKLDVGATQTMSSAPSDVGRGGKAFGHDIKEGHPVEAGKALGKGVGSGAKAVGEGVKSGAVGVKDKVGEGMSKVGHKVSGKTNEEKNKAEQKKKEEQQEHEQAPPPQQNPPQR